MENYPRIRKYAGVFVLLGALMVSLTGCFTNLPDIFGTPTPSPTPNPNVLIDPEIDLDPIGGYAGTLVRVTGDGWMPEKLVILKLEDDEGRSGILAANIPDSQGLFQASFNYPGGSRWLRPGFSRVVAYALNEDLETTAQFVVIEPTATPTSESADASSDVPTNTDTPTGTPTGTPADTSTATPTRNSDDAPTGTSTITNTPQSAPVETAAPTVIPTATATSFEFFLLPTATVTSVALTLTPVLTPVLTPAVTATQTFTATPPEASPTSMPLPETPVPEVTIPDIDSQNFDDDANEADGDAAVISAEQVSTPSGDVITAEASNPDGSIPSETTPSETTPSEAIPATVLALSAAPTGAVPVGMEPNGTPTVELGPFPAPADPTATPNVPTFTPTWTPAPEIVVIEEWRGDYWPNADLSGPALVIRNDRTIDFEWGGGSPAAGIPGDNFSARWSRTLRFEEGIFTFVAEVDDGARLYVDGQLLIDSWENGGRRTLTAQKILSEGQHQLTFEYYDNQGNATARLGWSGRATFQGWRGEYFANRGLNGRSILVRDDAAINFEWGIDSPAPTLPEDGFSVRWQRRLNLTGGDYRFRATADDGIRVWVDDLLIIDEWRDQSENEFIAELTLAGGSHDVRVEYYESTLGAIAKFSWEKVVIPTLAPTPTWTPIPTFAAEPTPTWTPETVRPTPTWTPER